MSDPKEHFARVEDLVREIFAELGEFEVHCEPLDNGVRLRVVVVSKSSDQVYEFDVHVRRRVTPQIADALF